MKCLESLSFYFDDATSTPTPPPSSHIDDIFRRLYARVDGTPPPPHFEILAEGRQKTGVLKTFWNVKNIARFADISIHVLQVFCPSVCPARCLESPFIWIDLRSVGFACLVAIQKSATSAFLLSAFYLDLEKRGARPTRA